MESRHIGSYNATTYDLVLPDIDSELWLDIWRDGYDVYSPKSICVCID